ncbi:DUF5060 domain-containing protein [Paenibacillus puerhi]|uniref:DUF5060 domain-containing protein n=1 Tax=Paenibacillus puerhi TaxID=2692622 RepID=UPI001356A07F|nr:DUF5060 domain-containing protein [Paenibacillus puerhi]
MIRSANYAAEAVPCWGRFEGRFEGPRTGNPYREVTFYAEFRCGNRAVEAEGFYDGEGIYKLRFMPDTPGVWTYETRSNSPQLDGQRGGFEAVEPEPGNRGMVGVKDAYRFQFSDGTPYLPFGTTLYHWVHHEDEAEEELTLSELAKAPFNKVRMCILPTGDMHSQQLAFAGSREAGADVSRFNPAFFAHLERRIMDLQQLGIEADLILFHPYDQGVWGFEQLEPETEELYLRYVIARLASFRNVWWSLANEFDFNVYKTMDDWDRVCRMVRRFDPYGHMLSIHNGTKMYDYTRTATYDYSKPWITHQSVQHWDSGLMAEWIRTHRKPVVLDECCYEGNAPRRWGNVPGEELVSRFWDSLVNGGYAAHGEVFGEPSWISRGGRLYGESPERIAFLRKLMEQGQADLWLPEAERTCFWTYLGISRPSSWELRLPGTRKFHVEVVDTWNMRVERLEGSFSGTCRIPLLQQSYLAIRALAAD